MKNKVLTGLLALALCAAAQDAAADAHAQKLADIRKLMSLTGADKIANQMLDQMGESMRTLQGAGSAKYFAEFRKEFDLNKIFELQIAAYDKHLSADDIESLVAFYESPAGRRMIEAMPEITSELMTQATQMSQEIARKLLKRMQDDPPK